jgi:flavin-dependent dehydrogenase
VRGLSRAGDVLELETSRDRLRARCVVAADGVHSPLARLAGWRAPVEAIPAIEAELDVDPGGLGERARDPVFDFGRVPAGYGWTFPKRAHVSAGVLTTARGRGGLRAQLERYGSGIGLGGVAGEARGWLIPCHPRRDGFARGGVLLAGDAAGLADPVTFEGISLALWSGRLAAACLLAQAFDPARAGAAYERALRAEILRDLGWARLAARLLYRWPRLTQAAFERAGPRFTEALADVFAGQATYRGAMSRPGAWLRVVRSQAPAHSIRP